MVERDGLERVGRSVGHGGLVWRRLQRVCVRGTSVSEQGGDARGIGSERRVLVVRCVGEGRAGEHDAVSGVVCLVSAGGECVRRLRA